MNLIMTAMLVLSVAAFKLRPVRPSIFALLGVPSKVTVKGVVWVANGVFGQPAELVRQPEGAVMVREAVAEVPLREAVTVAD